MGGVTAVSVAAAERPALMSLQHRERVVAPWLCLDLELA